jgi:tripeptide aminopeptidase
MIHGGSAINVIPEHCRIEAEVRSIDADRAAAVTTETVDYLQDAANAAECDLDLTVEQMFSGYRTKAREPQLAVAERALQACGYEPRPIVSGGASDANSFQAAGFSCACLADGTERNHTPDERISAQSLEHMLEIAVTLVDEAAAELAPNGERRPG